MAKRGISSSKVLADISKNRYKKANSKVSSWKRHCESTKASDSKNLYYDDLPNGNMDKRSAHRNLIMKHSHIINNGSQTTRHYSKNEEKIFDETSPAAEIGKYLKINVI